MSLRACLAHLTTFYTYICNCFTYLVASATRPSIDSPVLPTVNDPPILLTSSDPPPTIIGPPVSSIASDPPLTFNDTPALTTFNDPLTLPTISDSPPTVDDPPVVSISTANNPSSSSTAIDPPAASSANHPPSSSTAADPHSRKRRLSATEEFDWTPFQPRIHVTGRVLAPELRARTQFSVTKIKLSTSLQEAHKGYKDVFRQVAEEYSIRRRDAMNLSLLMVSRWVHSQYDDLAYPDITTHIFWSHAYRIVSNGVDLYNRNIDFSLNMAFAMNMFEMMKRPQPGTGPYYYDVPPMDALHGSLATEYTTDMIQNVGVFLSRHVRSILKKFFKGFFLHYKYQMLVDCDPMELTTLAINCVINNTEDELSVELPNDANRIIALNEYRIVSHCFQVLTRDSNCTLEQLEDYDTALLQARHILRFSAGLLSRVETSPFDRIKRWSMAPQPQHGIVHFPFSGASTIYHFLRRVSVSTPRDNILRDLPIMVLTPEGNMISYTQFTALYQDVAMKTRLWEDLFNFRKIRTARESLRFVNSLKTDGHMASFLFEKTVAYRLSTDRDELNLQPRRVNLQHIEKGIYPLSKNPVGLSNSHVIGIDPGVRDIIVGVGPQRNESIRFSNAQYKVRSGMLWITQQELKKREAANMQPVYDRIVSSKSAIMAVICAHIRSISQTHNLIFDFMKKYNHREAKGYNYSNRRAALSHVSNLVAGHALLNEPFNLCHKTISKSRQKKRNSFRRRQEFTRRDVRTIVAYGAASIMGTMRGHTPVPIKKTIRAIGEKSVVILTNEFRTSVTCSTCHERLNNRYRDEVLLCNHKKKKTRFHEKNTTRKCISDAGRVICRTSDCAERVASRAPKHTLIYPLKSCTTCLDGNKVWDRDINAAINIRGVLVDYISSSYDPNSRHLSLS